MRRGNNKGREKENGREDVLANHSKLTIEAKQVSTENRYVNRAGLKNERDILAILNDELEGHYQLGKAVDTGDCFFDALAQYMNILNDTDVNTIAYLRRLCHDYYTKNKEEIDGWHQADYGGLDKGREEYYMVQFWGRPWVEGRILIQQLDINKFLVIEVLEDAETGKPVVSYHLVTKDSYNSIDAEVCKEIIQEEGIPVLVNGQSSLHYVPLLRATEIREREQDNTTTNIIGITENKKREADGIKQEKLEMAKNMLEDGEGVEKIMRWTKLNKQEIDKLLQEKKAREEKLDIAKEMLADGASTEKIIKWTKLTRRDVEKLQSAMITSTTTQTTISTSFLPKLNPKPVADSKEIIQEDKIKNNLPVINYPEKAIVEMLEEIKMSQFLREQVRLSLENIKKRITEIRRYQLKEYVEQFYTTIKAAIVNIKNTAILLYDDIKHLNPALSNSLYKLFTDAITPLEMEINKKTEMPDMEREKLNLKTKALYASQSYIVRQEAFKRKLNDHLLSLKELLIGLKKPICCFSYAWPSQEKEQEEYWVKPFLSILYDHLTTAGIKVSMDIRDNKPGHSIVKFMNQHYNAGNYVILIGTESLLNKYNSDRMHVIKSEVKLLLEQVEEDKKVDNHSRLCPLLISGTMATSFPPIFSSHITVKDAREEKGYPNLLEYLISWLYDGNYNELPPRYSKLWEEFLLSFSGLSRDAAKQEIEEELSIGFHRKEIKNLLYLNKVKESEERSVKAGSLNPVIAESERKHVLTNERQSISQAVNLKSIQNINDKPKKPEEYIRKKILSLDLSNKRKTYKGEATLFSKFNENNIQTLTLSNNRITDGEINNIFKNFSRNTIHTIILQGNLITQSGLEELKRLLEKKENTIGFYQL